MWQALMQPAAAECSMPAGETSTCRERGQLAVPWLSCFPTIQKVPAIIQALVQEMAHQEIAFGHAILSCCTEVPRPAKEAHFLVRKLFERRSMATCVTV